MQLDKTQVRRAFDRAATTYDRAAVVQERMAAELISRLQYVQLEPHRILDVGCGTGTALKRLQKIFPRAQCVGLDIAPAMLRQARGGWTFRRREQWLCADAERLPVAESTIDLVFACAVLQWCDLDAVFGEVRRVLREDGMITFATLGPDTLRELRDAWRGIDSAVHVHEFVDMHDVGDALIRAGFSDPVLDVDMVQLTYADPDTALNEIRAVGSTNAATGRRRTLTAPGRVEALAGALSSQRGSDGRFALSFEIVYGHAWSASPRQTRRQNGSVSVPLAGIRRPS